MNRREFFRRAGGGAVLGMPFTAFAAPAPFPRHPFSGPQPAPLILIGRADLPAAMALAQRLEAALHGAGLRTVLLRPEGDALRRIEHLDALLAQPAGTPLLGIMDDASAVILQAVAGSRGARTLAHAHHRGAAGATRHCCHATAHGQPIAWREAAHGAHGHVERFYLAALGGAILPTGDPLAGAGAAITADSLASFLLRL